MAIARRTCKALQREKSLSRSRNLPSSAALLPVQDPKPRTVAVKGEHRGAAKNGLPAGLFARRCAETAKDSLRGMADATTDKVKDAAESTHAMASNVAQEVREYAEEAQTEAGQVFYGQKQFRSSMEKNLKERPVATIAAISLIAFLLGALWKK